VSISVVIPAYNAARYLRETLETVSAQTHTDFECIVVDDGSTDNTQLLARKFLQTDARFRVECRTNGGLPAARNTGLHRSDNTRPYVIFLDADDRWAPTILDRLRTLLETDPQAVGAYAMGRFIGPNGEPIREKVLETAGLHRRAIRKGCVVDVPIEDPTDFDALLYRNTICTAGTLLLRREPLIKAGCFNETFKACEDWDCWLRLSTLGHFLFLPEVLLDYRRHDANMSSDDDLMRFWKRQTLANVAQCSVYSEKHRLALAGRARALAEDERRNRRAWAAGAAKRGRIIQAVKQLRHAARVPLPRVGLPSDLSDIQLVG
jgi:glycosyltransferase involved in cell wall biosynthesis